MPALPDRKTLIQRWKLLGLSFSDIGKRLGVSKQAVHQYLNVHSEWNHDEVLILKQQLKEAERRWRESKVTYQ